MSVEGYSGVGLNCVSRSYGGQEIMRFKEKIKHYIFKDKFTISMMALGVALVITLPFGVAAEYALSEEIVTWIMDSAERSNGAAKVLEAWTVAAIVWSLLYLLFYMFFKFPSAYPGSTKAGTLFTCFTLVIGLVVTVLYGLDDGTGAFDLAAQTVIVLWLVVIDVLLVYGLSVEDEVKRDYKLFLWGVDLPGLVGFGVLFLFHLLCPKGSESALSAFVTGAAAMNLVVINTGFALLFLRVGGYREEAKYSGQVM